MWPLIMQVRSDVAAVLMEEVAPLAVSKASMQTPKEAYNPEAAGDVRADGELTRWVVRPAVCF